MTEPGRPPSAAALLLGQARHANREFWRTPIAAFFTLALPLGFLVILAALFGNTILESRSGIRLAQFMAPAFAVYGAATAAFISLATATATARERGVLKRLRGSPLPPWVMLGGRIASAAWIALLAVLLVVGAGVALYGVQIPWARLPAVALTLLVGTGCFAALGLAVVALTPSASAALAVSTGVLLPLAFISDVFGMADAALPGWLDALGWFFPLRHLANAVADGMNPLLDGYGFYPVHLAVLVAWGVAGAVVAVRWFSWEPHRVRPPRPVRTPARAEAPASRGRPGPLALVRGQIRYADRTLLRQPSAVFFGLVFPVLLLAFFAGINGPGAQVFGVGLAQYLAPVFTVYGIAVTAYVNLPEALATARDRGVLTRLRGTPLPWWAFLTGRIVSAALISALTAVLMFGVGAVFFDVRIEARSVLPAVLVLAACTACFVALGLALVALCRSARTLSAISLGTLLPLAFVSGIFVIGADLPAVLSAIGWIFPLRHLAVAAFEATEPGGPVWTATWWGHLGVAAAWTVAGVLVARGRLYSEPGTRAGTTVPEAARA